MTADTPPPRGPAVVFSSVRVNAGDTVLLRDVDLRVEAGTLHALVGPNGAGKTTLLRSLLGGLPHAGRITLHWTGSAGRVAYVPQTLDFDRHLPVTAEDFLGLVLQRAPLLAGLRREAAGRVARALAEVGLASRRRTRLGSLSGGELRRLLIAQALIPDTPGLLILDEPMNHLDTAGLAFVAALLNRLKSESVTILVTLHDLSHVRELADAVTGLAAGRVLFTGAPGRALTPEAVVALYTAAPVEVSA